MLKKPHPVPRRFFYERRRRNGARLIRALRIRKGRPNVLMLHLGRSGSTVLSRQLAQHPAIYWDGELLRWPRVNRLDGQLLNSFDAFGHVDLCRFKSYRKLYGFELKPGHLVDLGVDFKHYVAHLRSIGFEHFITVERRNILRRLISAKIVWLTGKAHLKTREKQNLVTVEFDPGKILDLIRHDLNEVALIKETVADDHHMDLVYEDHIEQDPAHAYRQVCDFLGIGNMDAEIRLKKRNPYPVSEMLENFDEIREVLEPTEYAWMLYA